MVLKKNPQTPFRRKHISLTTTLLLLSIICHAQKTIETWYDENWQDTHEQLARYYSHLEHTDSGWYRKDMYVSARKWQMLGLYEDKECTQRNGVFRFFYPDGSLKSYGVYEHNKKKGLCLEFYADGTIKDSAYYVNGHIKDEAAGWYKNGNPEYKVTYDDNGNGVYTNWFDNGQPSSAGRYKNFDKKNGRWQFFHKNGKVSAVELYDTGEMKASQYFKDDGSPEEDTGTINQSVSFPGGKKAWSKYLNSALYFPSNLDIKNGYHAVLVVTATIDETGKITDVEVDLPLHPQMDKIAVQALLKSPLWIPEKQHNRNVVSKYSQSVSFERSYE
jgi:antitoxin component YwqK of YwqJK toxin-antitoxin module